MIKLSEVKSINIDTIKEYLKKHNIITKARNIIYYNNGEYVQIGNILIKFDLYGNKEDLLKTIEFHKNDDHFKRLITQAENEINLIDIYNINSIPVLEIYQESKKPKIDFGGNIQSPCLFDREFILYPHLMENGFINNVITA